MTPEASLLLQQICDSVFPIGAYAHSYGLETYIQRGLVSDEATAQDYILQQIRWPLTHSELLGMRLAYEAAQQRDAEALLSLEQELRALKTPAETRAASERLAGRFLRTVASMDSLAGESGEFFAAYRASAPQHAVNAAYGVFAACAGIDLPELLARYLYAQVSALVVTCVKTIPLSQTAGQNILFALQGEQVEAVRKALGTREEDLGLSCPGFDVRSIEHESLYSRLYMS